MSFLINYFTKTKDSSDFNAIPDGVNINYTSFKANPTNYNSNIIKQSMEAECN